MDQTEQLMVEDNGLTCTIPFVDLDRGNGPSVLVTAGMDGDEYAGIEAANQFIELSKRDTEWKGRRIIVPIVNILGNAVGVSVNPSDNLYPKHIYPGNVSGSVSEKILYTITKKWPNPDLWLDLHGGNRVEELQPFIWGFPYGTYAQKNALYTLLSSVDTNRKIIAPWKKAMPIINKGTTYIVLESGQRGVVDDSFVKQHLRWIDDLLNISNHRQSLVYYQKIHFCNAKIDGYFTLEHRSSTLVKNDLLGTIVSLSGDIQRLYASTSGVFLWRRVNGWVKKYDTCYAFATDINSKQIT